MNIRLVCLLPLLLMGCSTVAFTVDDNDLTTLDILTNLAASETCRVTLKSRDFVIPEQAAAFEAELVRLREKYRIAVAEGDEDAPYRCIGAAISHAHRAGFMVFVAAGSMH